MLVYHHTQDTSATTWTITHNLDLTASSVEAFIMVNAKWQPILPQSVTKTANQIVIKFSTARAGKAVVHGSTGEIIDYTGFVAPIERPIDYTHSPTVIPE